MGPLAVANLNEGSSHHPHQGPRKEERAGEHSLTPPIREQREAREQNRRNMRAQRKEKSQTCLTLGKAGEKSFKKRDTAGHSSSSL
jgi:hypothetical protein